MKDICIDLIKFDKDDIVHRNEIYIDKNCPCVNCITLGICKASIKGYVPVYITLGNKCSIFKKHYIDTPTHDLNLFSATLLELFRPHLFK